MKTTIKSFTVLFALAMAACNNPGGYNGNGGGGYSGPSQTDLANQVVAALNADAYNYGGYTYSLVKAVSYSDGYSVLYNDQTGHYVAIYVDQYAGGSGQDYFNAESDANGVYYNLYDNGNGFYTDLNTGYTFSKVDLSNDKDLRGVKQDIADAKTASIANSLVTKGLFSNTDAATNVAKAMVAYSDLQSKHEESTAAADALGVKAFGSSFTEAMAALKSGDTARQNAILERANAAGIGSNPDQAREAITNLLKSI